MRIIENFDLSNCNAYKLKAHCKRAIFPERETDFIQIFNQYKENEIIVIGNGNNLLLSKVYYDKTFIILNSTFNNINVHGNIIQADSGATMLDVCMVALENNLSGLEFSYDIPSSVGGAVVMNAGTKEGDIESRLVKVRYFDKNSMAFFELGKPEINFDYRNSVFQNDKSKIITKAWFELISGESNSIKFLMDESKNRRWLAQPREFPNAGSVFKRPEGKYVGPMIESLGLKGFSIGGAQISEKHCGFIINRGNATGQDILELISYIQRQVFQHFNIFLEIEQRII